jgi:hypothetical protein
MAKDLNRKRERWEGLKKEKEEMDCMTNIGNVRQEGNRSVR